MDITTRKLTGTDLQPLQAISKATFMETFAAVNTEANMQRYLQESFSDEKLAEELNNPGSEFYFALLDQRVIGYLKINTGVAQTELKEAGGLEIERIYVLKEFHGLKVGQVLFNLAMEMARRRGFAYVWLGVWEENHRAIAFYRKNGFEAFDKHVFHLGDDAQTDLLMRCWL